MTDSRSDPCGCAIPFALHVHLKYLSFTDKSIASYIQSNVSEFGRIRENINHYTTSLLRKLARRIIPLPIKCYNNGFHALGYHAEHQRRWVYKTCFKRGSAAVMAPDTFHGIFVLTHSSNTNRVSVMSHKTDLDERRCKNFIYVTIKVFFCVVDRAF